MLFVFSSLLMLHDRMLNTAHEGLTVAGGLFLDVHSAKDTQIILFYAVYKYLMAGLLNPISILDDIPYVLHCPLFQNPMSHVLIISAVNSW